MKKFLTIPILFFTVAHTAFAYPPAPHHVIEGLVRDEQGRPVVGDNIKVVAVSNEGGIIVTSVNQIYGPGVNYSLQIPMESGVARNLFNTSAFLNQMEFSLKVQVDGKDYLPIEMIGNTSKMGLPGETTYLDLTLGEDSDGDGLPDAWEQGIAAFTGKSIDQINPNDDSDGDGLSNLQEYLSGNYAFDKNDGVIINMKQLTKNNAKFEFLGITGRTYSVETSLDLKEWKRADFNLGDTNDEGPFSHIIAKKVGPISIDVSIKEDQVGENLFFKLKVQ